MKRPLFLCEMRVVLLALLMLGATPAWAEWVRYAESNSGTSYLDPATVRKDGNLRRVWTVSDFKVRASIGALSLRSLNEYDCKEEKYRVLSISGHSGPMATGQVLASETPNDPWDYIAPGTAEAYSLRFVCAQYTADLVLVEH